MGAPIPGLPDGVVPRAHWGCGNCRFLGHFTDDAPAHVAEVEYDIYFCPPAQAACAVAVAEKSSIYRSLRDGPTGMWAPVLQEALRRWQAHVAEQKTAPPQELNNG